MASRLRCPLTLEYDGAMTYSSGPRLSAKNNPGNARWCDAHNRLECTKTRSFRQGGGPCHAPAIRGTDACHTHGGHRNEVLKAKGQARITAWSAMGQPANGAGIGSSAAVLGMLQQSWLRAAMYGHLLQLQVARDGRGEEAVPGQFDPEGKKSPGGLIGFKYGAAGKEGHIYAVSEEARALVKLEAEERDRVVKFAKTAHEMGISDRIIGLAESWGDQVVKRIMIIMMALELSPEQEARVPRLIRAHLGTIELGGSGS